VDISGFPILKNNQDNIVQYDFNAKVAELLIGKSCY